MEELIELKLRELLSLMSSEETKESSPVGQSKPGAVRGINQRCPHCGAAIGWFRTAANGKMAALEAKPGTYVINQDGEAEFVGCVGGDFAYHYGDPACPGTPKRAVQPNSQAQESAFESLTRELGLTLPRAA